jgi:hypothetical protein
MTAPISPVDAQKVWVFSQNADGTLSPATIGGGGGSGTVTNVATTSPITGGPITTTGTIGCATCTTSAAAITSNVIPKGSGGGQGIANSSLSDDGTVVTTSEPISSGTGFENATGTAAEQYLQFGRTGIGIAVPYYRPTNTNTAVAFDISPNGSPSDFTANTGVSWIDICSTDCTGAGVTNYESLRMGKFTTSTQSSAAHVSAAKGGTGTVRSLILQLNGGSVGIGALPVSGSLLSGTGDTAFTQYCDASHANCFTPASVANMPAQQPLGPGSNSAGPGLSVAGATSAEGFISVGNGSYGHFVIHITTTDNSANTYNFGVYNAAGTLLCSTGAIAGSTFATANGSKQVAFTSNCTLVQGSIYYFAYSAVTANTLRLSGVGGAATIGGDSLTPFANAQVSASSMPGTISAPTVAYASTMGTGPWFGLTP